MVEDEGPSRDPMAVAIEWVGKITTVSLEMVLPALGGWYLDNRFHTKFWIIVGAVLGLAGGMLHLLQMTAFASENRNSDESGKSKRPE